jgi:hypothetical protein
MYSYISFEKLHYVNILGKRKIALQLQKNCDIMNHYSLPHEVVQYKNLAGVRSSNIVPPTVMEAKSVRSGLHNNHDSHAVFHFI